MRKLVLFAIPFGVAALVYVYLLSSFWGLLLGGLFAVCCIVLCFLKIEKKQVAAIIAAGLALGFLWSAGYECLRLKPIWTVDGEKTEIEAVVCDYPVKTDYGCKIKTELTVNGKTAKTLLYLNTVPEGTKPADRLRTRATLRSTEAAEEDDTLYNLSAGYVLCAYAGEAELVPCEKIPTRFYPAVFSQRLRAALAAAVPEDAEGFLQALITGDKTGISQKTQDEISAAGFSHVIAVSGMHVSILLGVLYFLTRKNPILSAILGLPLIVFFILMTGASASVVRAGVMQALVLLAPLFRRDADGPTSLSAAMLVILLINPFAVAGISFQLSFGAVIGIFLCASKAYQWLTKPEWMKKLLHNRWLKPIVAFICSCIASTLGALLFTVPLSALYFGKVSLYAMLSNLLVLSVISFCFAGGLLTGFLGLFCLPAAKIFGWLTAWLTRYILWVASWVSKLPFASVSAASPYISMWLIFAYLLLFAAVLQKEKKPVVLTAGCIFVSLAVSLTYLSLDNGFSDFSIAVLDVGQGECICMRAEDLTVMVDCGGESGNSAADTAVDYLNMTSWGKLDGLLLTHYDKDHTNGVPLLLSEVRVGTLYLPDVPDDSGRRAQIEAAARTAGTQIVYVTSDITLNFQNGSVQLFAPVSNYDDNAACLSVLFSAAEYDMLITGDMDFFSEYDLLLTHELPDVELFIAGHHGSATSSSADLLAKIKPETVIISVGKDNIYGHPTQEALDRFLAVGADIYRTDECGTLTVGR